MGYFSNLQTEKEESGADMDDYLFYLNTQEVKFLENAKRINSLQRIANKSKKQLKFFSKDPITKMNLNTKETK